jgi:hypothetical protein
MSSDYGPETTAVIIVLSVVAIACLFFPRALVRVYEALLGESYARLLHPIALPALGVILAVLFCFMFFGMLHKQRP